MPRLPRPRIKYFWSYVFMAGLALFVLGMVAIMGRPHPPAVEAGAWNPEWHCSHPLEGDPICVRDLPPAAKPGISAPGGVTPPHEPE
jgi:hypothetical protein